VAGEVVIVAVAVAAALVVAIAVTVPVIAIVAIVVVVMAVARGEDIEEQAVLGVAALAERAATCGQWLANWVASRMPRQRAARSGGFQRRSPTGAAAYGMPRNTRVVADCVPRSNPPSVSAIAV